MSRPVVSERVQEVAPKTRTYVVGFLLSVILTFAAYLLVVRRSLPTTALIWVIAILAVVQFGVQMLFFLHLSQESRPRWRLVAMLLMLVVVMILVFGSIWIMWHLNYNMRMTPSELQTYMKQNEGL